MTWCYIDLFAIAKPVKTLTFLNYDGDVTRKLFENLDKLVEIQRNIKGGVAQFNDMLAWFSKRNWKVLTQSSKTSSMIKRHLVKGNNDQLFYARTLGDGVRIYRIAEDGSEVEVFELKESTIIFFESDNESIE